MKDSIKYGDEGGKDFGCAADELTPQACYRSPVADMEVSWAVSGAGATLGSATTSTDENGLAINTLKSS
ncbi:Ig-like domain-containing protein [Yersinia hibernica]|uniref:Uncharacterized protein n=1 Tax=Yersinia enterocolitica LC20 TaxID=1443113 RepID=A0A7U4K3G4_YEREN|nr:hypothetical protein [Yersinia hibernica]AHM76739.1 hypothetical protein LC20_06249 [Yersinia hibernica]AHM76750.1 hypothetical protein LC20_06260 [Yersinia hibernica]